MAPLRLSVRAEALQVSAQYIGAQVPATLRFRQDQEARVVADQVEPLELEFLGPAQPWVAGLALEHAGLPARQRYPLAPPCGDVPQPAPGDLLEARLVRLVHQPVPGRPFARAGQLHGYVAQLLD